jgi:hypothetical protein
MSKVPLGVERQTLYVAARRVLLDALDALAGQREALILVGAQAVYLRSGDANLQVAVYTADADLSIDRTRLSDIPLLERAMLDGGFQLSSNSAGRQPGQWFRTVEMDGTPVDIPIDLLIPGQFSGTSKNRRTPNLDPHDRMAVRKVAGLELATVDNDIVQITSLEPNSDSRSINIKVAKTPALLVAKAYKIHDRANETKPGRAADKDAGDVIRLMRTSDPRKVGTTFGQLLVHADPRIKETTQTGLGFLKEQFGRVRGSGIEMAQRALAGALAEDTIRGLATAYVRELPDWSVG